VKRLGVRSGGRRTVERAVLCPPPTVVRTGVTRPALACRGLTLGRHCYRGSGNSRQSYRLRLRAWARVWDRTHLRIM